MFSCDYCSYVSKRRYDVKTHKMRMHKNEYAVEEQNVHTFEADKNLTGVFDIRLKENFKLFVSGPSRCGKTVLISKLLENIHNFSRLPPKTVLYIYKVWQLKYDENWINGSQFHRR